MTDTACQPLQRTLFRRIKWFWQDRGEWIVAPVLGLMLIGVGYSIENYVSHRDIVEVVVKAQAERDSLIAAHEADIRARVEAWNDERDYFRDNAEKKNNDIRDLTATLAKMGIDTSSTAKTATEAAKTATETNKNLSNSLPAKP